MMQIKVDWRPISEFYDMTWEQFLDEAKRIQGNKGTDYVIRTEDRFVLTAYFDIGHFVRNAFTKDKFLKCKEAGDHKRLIKSILLGHGEVTHYAVVDIAPPEGCIHLGGTTTMTTENGDAKKD